MEGRVLLTTTPTLQGIDIKEYVGLITVRNVRAVNVIRDLFTAFRDIFGGRSGAYQEVMDDIENEVLSELRNKAATLGCNAVIGINIDFDNVGSKGKSLIMAYAKGTAVKV